MINEVEEGQYVWFVIPQELSFYPVVRGARVVSATRDWVSVRWLSPQASFRKSELYSTRKKAYYASIEVLKQKVERMKLRTVEMERHVITMQERTDTMCVCETCDVDELSLHQPCIEKA